MKKLATNRHGTRAAQRSKPTPLICGLVGLLILAAVPGSSFAAEPAYTFSVVATLGDPAPGGGLFTTDFEPSALNNRGQLAFTADLAVAGDGGAFHEGLFLSGGGGIQQIVRYGQSAPGAGTFSVGELGTVGLNDNGDVGFGFSLEPFDFSTPLHGGVYRWSSLNQTLTPVMIPNVTPDPSGGVFVGADFDVSLNNQGALVFCAYVTNTPLGLGRGAFVQDKSGHITNIMRPGDAAPEGGAFIRALNPCINDAGDITFTGKTLDTAHYFQAYIRNSSTGATTLVPQPTGVIGANAWAINNHGVVAIGGNYPAGAGFGNVYLSEGVNTTLVASVGSPAPGGGNFSFITAANVSGANLAVNNLGNTAFDAATDTGDEAVYFYSSATRNLSRVAGIGTVIPGVGMIISLEQGELICCPPAPLTGTPISGIAMNDRNQVAFAAKVINGSTVHGVLVLATPRGF